MRVKIAIFLAGLILGSTASAAAVVDQSFWQRGGSTYLCKGSYRSVFCKETNWYEKYEVSIIPGQISVSYRNSLIFACERRYRPADNCAYYGR